MKIETRAKSSVEHPKGLALLSDPARNKGTAFTRNNFV